VSTFLQWLVFVNFILITGLLLFISWQDILLRIISNSSLIVLLCLVVPYIALQQRFPNVIAAVVVIAFFFPLFIFNIIGGGDVKLMSVLSMAFSWQQNADFFFIIAIFGSVIGIFGFLFYRQITRERGVPYGVAISLAFVFYNIIF